MSSTISTSRPSIGGVEVLEDAHDAGGVGRRAVGGDRHEVDLARDVELAHEVGRKKTAPLSTPMSSRSRPLVVARDLGAELADAVLQLVGLDEDLADGSTHAWRGVYGSPAPGQRARGVAGRAAKRSPVATPGTQAISPPDTTTGSARAARAGPCGR